MRITQPSQVSLLDPAAHPLGFAGQRNERFQVSVLEEDLIRVQHWPDGQPRLDRTWLIVGPDGDVPREGRRRDDLSPFSLPGFDLEVGEAAVRLRTRQLGLDISLRDLCLRWADARGRPFAADLSGRAYAHDRECRAVYHYLERRPDEHYYGFGERAGPLDKAGRRMRMFNLDALGYDAQHGDPLYKHFPFYITFLPDLQVAYGLLYDNLATTVFDMGCEVDNYYPPYRYYRADDGDVDYYLIYGPTIEEVVKKLSTLTGHMALPPRWSLGYLGSTMTYTEAPDAQAQLEQFVELCNAHRIPCDLFHLSSGYSASDEGKRYVFTWNRNKIPDPRGLAHDFHQAGIRLAANIKPCLLTDHPRYSEVAALGGFIQAADVDEPELSAFWGGHGAHIDFTNPVAYEWWRQQVLDCLLALGIDATWNDNNEYTIWDDKARCVGFGQPLPVGLVRPLHPLLMARASREAQLQSRPDQRPYLISRSGCPGIQRYAQTWSGDNATSWHSLRYNIPMGLGLSLSGAPNTGHDVGGFTGHRPEPELFVRWVQNGVFHPRFTIHSWNTDGTVNEPWMYPEVLPIIRQAIEFRYRLLPYLYTLCFEAARSGRPMIRPLVYQFQDPRCHTESFDFMMGPNLLVASVLEPGARTRSLYLPDAGDWCDFHSGRWYSGGQVIEAEAPLEHIPLFVPAGGILPLGKLMRHVGEQPDNVRQVHVFPHPHRGRGEFTLIEDDGISLGYQRGEYAEVRLEVVAESECISLRVALPHRGYPLPYTELEIILPAGEGRRVAGVAGTEIEAVQDGRRRVRIPVPGQPSEGEPG
ncbi:MAG: glycoside hydrolase family 31 protein [Anaerolineae bacterium]|nr:glycoside hydrolase family 31 protein [Anaerolineae bacterium]